MQFCKEYNAATQDKVGTVIPVEITCFEVMLLRGQNHYNCTTSHMHCPFNDQSQALLVTGWGWQNLAAFCILSVKAF